MLSDFLTPVTIEGTYSPHQLGSSILTYPSNIQELDGIKLAIIGVREGRGSGENEGTSQAPSFIRKAFYNLSSNALLTNQMVDLGDITEGELFRDTESALRMVLVELKQQGISCIIMGGSIELSYAVYKVYEGVSNNVDLTYISSNLPMMQEQILSKICAHQPNYLFNINALGFQSHSIPSQCLDIMDKLGFNQMRLGQLKTSPDEAEPWIRNTHLFLMDMGAIKQADAPANFNNNPSGIEGDLACKLSHYAGISDLTSNFGLFELNPIYDNRGQSSKLAAQCMWYFMEGFANRVNDHPHQHQEFLRYRCSLDERQPDLIFHKSKRTSRWWMEVPNPKSLNNSEMNVIVPCSYADYQQAAKGEVSDRFLKTIQKMH